MEIDKEIVETEIDRHVGQSLFVGPGDMGVLVDNSLTSKWRRAMTLKCALNPAARLFTQKGIVEALPRRAKDGADQVFARLRGASPEFVVDDVRQALGLFDVLDVRRARSLPHNTDHIEFGRLYFLLSERVRAMINVVLTENSRGARFNVFAERGTDVSRHERLLARMAVISESGKVPRDDAWKAQIALEQLRNLDFSRSSGKFKRLNDVLRTMNNPGVGVAELLAKYKEVYRQ